MKNRVFRGLACFFAFLFCLSTFGTVFSPVVYGEGTADSTYDTVPKPDGDPQPSGSAAVPDAFKVRIGLMYGTAVTVGFETVTTAGYLIGAQTMQGDSYSFRSLWSVPDTLVAVLCDGNLSKVTDEKKDVRSYSFAVGTDDVAVGGYHIILRQSFDSETALRAMIDEKAAVLAEKGLYAFPAYESGEYQLRVGSFTSVDQAVAEGVVAIAALFPGSGFAVAEPTESAVTLVDPKSDRILFEFNDPTGVTALGLYPASDGTGEAYIKTPASNLYAGVFAYSRYRSGSVDGVSVTNVLPLEEYIMGVLPYEVSSSWNQQMLMAFAIVVRTYTLTNLNRHYHSYGFDLCNTSNCQVYRGAKSVTDSVRRAVLDTEGLVVSYGQDLAKVYYASSFGGVSVKASDVWGGDDLPYLTAQLTPWEKFMEYPKSFWIVEVSGEELCRQLNSQGYTELKGSVEQISVDEYCTGSTYVKTMTFRDSSGHEVTVTGPSRIRTTLTGYLYSANFVVGKGSVQYTEGVYLPGTAPSADTDPTGVISAPADITDVRVQSALETFVGSLFGGTVLTASGTEILDGTEAYVQRLKNDTDGLYQTAVAKDAGSFVFVGKGWGHGVGMSQYGAKDLGDAGMAFEGIVKTYFPGTTITTYQAMSQQTPPDTAPGEIGGPSETEDLVEDTPV